MTAEPLVYNVSDRGGLAAAYRMAVRSPDPSTQNGTVIAWNSLIVAEGYNRFPEGVEESDERWERPTKYAFVCHAEVMAVLRALRAGVPMADATMFVLWYACTDCAKVIIESGLRHVVGHANLHEFAAEHSPGWKDSIATALTMLDEAGVRCEWYEGPIDGPNVRIGGALFSPFER